MFALAGITLPKLGMFWLMDRLTVRECSGLPPLMPPAACPAGKAAAEGANACTALGGTCVIARDGFFPLAYGAALGGAAMGLLFLRVLPRLEALPADVWRVRSRKLR